MKVKICGVTSVTDALMCVEAGADMIGLNFYPKSPRFLSRQAAAEVARALRALPAPPTLVGVFVNELVEDMKATMEACGLDLAQLSGDEGDEILAAMGKRAFKAIRAFRLPSAADQLVLYDAHAAGQYGGTGQMADWSTAADLALRCRLLLAGGLTPNNVAAAARQVRPWGVDVASGVEARPGVKDPAKVSAFITSAKTADG